jgi:hypothetical protein
LLIAVNEQLCSNSNPGRSAALKRGHAEYGGGHEVAGRITIEIDGDASTVIAVIAFLAMAGAWVSGARFVGGQSSSASFGMAAATAIALMGYVTIFFLPARRVS